MIDIKKLIVTVLALFGFVAVLEHVRHFHDGRNAVYRIRDETKAPPLARYHKIRRKRWETLPQTHHATWNGQAFLHKGRCGRH